ncbi:MAG TPA: SDR family NAD(P)-dependent oxidoreductase [Planctomycetota bacterium]|nr:SDR family NAD(P)-dependent oxidoreductase [Planctomycetota bacterium]
MHADAPVAARLEGCRALVTGSSSGIGRAILLELAGSGAAVIAHANRSFARAEALAAEVARRGTRAIALEADLRDPEACRRLVARAFEALGGIDVWVNNAGADILTEGGQKMSFESKLEMLLEVDVRATMLLTRDVGRIMKGSGGGSIVNMGWDKAATGMEGDAGELFAAAKGAIMSFTRSAALSLAPRVRVNCIAPGWIRTAWGETAGAVWQERVLRETPLRRWGTPEDVAHVARFLASGDAAFLTGQVIAVNGGVVR